MKRLDLLKAALAAAALAVVAACGGGGAEGGIGGTGNNGGGTTTNPDVAYGQITAFGSVWVNGVEYSTSGTSFKLDDNSSATQNDLRVGMVVRVDGSIAGKTAGTITVDDAVKGRIEQVIDASQIVVMGQTVQIDNQTLLEDSTLTPRSAFVPTVNQYVHVHGQVSGDGTVSASLIERKGTPGALPFAVKGIVKNQTATTFQVGTLTVNYSGATKNDMPAGSWNGLQVDVKGSACTGTPVCGTLTATQVEPAGARVTTAAKAEVEGVIVTLAANGFTIGNQQVVTTGSTRYEGGVAADLAVGAKVEAEGSISNGVLTATKVSFRDSVRIEGQVLTSSVSGNTATLTFTGLPGITVSVSSIAKLGSGVSLAGITTGTSLRVRGRPGSAGQVVASELDSGGGGGNARVILQAPADAVASPNVTLLGIVVNTTGASFQDSAGNASTSAAFFAAAKVGTIVKARARVSGNSLSWDEIEIEE